MKVWSAHTGHLLHTLRAHESPVNDISLDSTDQVVASGAGNSNGTDTQVRLWNINTGHPVAILKGTFTLLRLVLLL